MSDKSSENDRVLKSMYPFLQNKTKGGVQDMSLVISVKQKFLDSIKCKENFYQQSSQDLIVAAHVVADSYRQGGKLFSMGNGGSSCDAAHIAVEFQHPVTAGRPALAAMNLNHDTAFFSAVANDIGIQHVFSRQIEAHGKKGDCVIGFSTSGNSDNLLKGFNKAHQMGLKTIAFVGGDGGEIKKSGLLDVCLVVPTDSIHRVQEVHMSCYHILWDLTHTLLADDRGNLFKGDKDEVS